MPATYVIDFETRSTLNVKDVGAWAYSCEPSTIPICLAFAALESDEPPTVWTYENEGTAILKPLFEAIADGAIIEAHNVFFERSIWENVCVARLGWPPISADQWRCTAARCAAVGLPRGLDDAGKLLQLPIQKDAVGNRKMQKVARPRKPTKNDPSVWNEKREDLDAVYAYCANDVVVEKLISKTIPELTPAELAIWKLDQQINYRGLQIDVELVDAAIALLDAEKRKADKIIARMTDGAVTALTQRERLLAWLVERGYPTVCLDATTVDLVLQNSSITDDARAALELKATVSKSSTAKFKKLRARTTADGRTRDTIIYQGASRTGRWAGTGVQFQNLPRGSFNDYLDDLVDLIKAGDADTLELVFGSIYNACASALRSAIIAAPGRRLIVCDFAAIEARVLAWLARESTALALFRTGADVYKDIAVDIYNVQGGVDAVTKSQRFVGKTCILGLGYQMGAAKFLATMEGYGFPIDERFADLCVDTFRTKFQEYPKFWRMLDRCAIAAVKSPGKTYRANAITFQQVKSVLWVTLPSGRRLAYLRPIIVENKFGSDAVAYFGQDQNTRQFKIVDTYGGKWAENITQAVARDLMADAMLRLEAAGYDNVLTVHDEAVLEVDDGFGSLADVMAIMVAPPAWARHCPIGAAGFEAKRYRKD